MCVFDFTCVSCVSDVCVCAQVCVKTRNNGWVVGRRANQSHREFFVLVDEKAGNLSDIQGESFVFVRVCLLFVLRCFAPHFCSFCVLCAEEVERLAKTYFYNILVH